MSTSNSVLGWQSLEKQLDSLLDLPPKQRALRLAELDQSEPVHADALRRWLADIDRAEQDPLAQTHDGERVGPWRALHRLGRGGMGDVWMAERNDGTYEKRVAIKFLYGDTPQLRIRLEMERHLLAQLQHPNIPRLIDGGVTAGGQPYLITDFVEGMPLDKWSLLQGTADFGARISIFRQIAAAVAHAHDNSVVHRDIKPNNVLVDRDGHAYLLDFGVARLLDEERRADTMQPLTLEYAAPEQIRNGKASVRTDIYGLGALFYFLIAKKPPFDFHNISIAACVKLIGEDMPVRPSATGAIADLPRELIDDLDAIALKALAKSPDDRYANVDGLLHDLDNAFAHRPIEARKLDGRWYRARRFVRRNGLALGVATAIVASLAVGLVLALWQARVAAEQRDQAQAARAHAETERANAQAQAVRSDMTVDFLLSVLGSAAPNNEAIKIDDLLALAAQRVSKEAENRPELYPLLFDTLRQAYEQRGNRQPLEQLLLPLLTNPQKTLPLSISAELSCSLADLERNLAKRDEARHWAEVGLQQAAALAPEQTREIRANCQRILAEVAVQSGKLDQAMEFYRQGIDALSNVPNDSRSVAQLFSNYGTLLTLADKPVEACAQFRKSIDIYTRLGRENSADALASRMMMANCTARIGFPLSAFDEMGHSIDLHLKATGPTANIAMMLVAQTQVAIDLARPEEATVLLDRSKTMVRDFAPKQMARFGVHWAVSGIRIAALLGDENQRDAKIAEAHEAADNLKLPPENLLRVIVRETEIFITTLVKTKNPQEALDRFMRAENELRALSSKSKPTLVKTMLGTAEAALDVGDTDLAGKKIKEAREFFVNVADPEGWQLDICDAVSAFIDWQNGKERPLARANLERAVARMRTALGSEHPRVLEWQARLHRLDATTADVTLPFETKAPLHMPADISA
ncbi:MAG: serine/threonine protein kinase [Rudaea sp.]|uniref:serine/threonine protein kinase n=1 Tax=unclassified Rudaea TaxID=2627037 RepID=UPI001484DE51|nr:MULTISPECIES: serine/threonine-protein kinase [unclassified Rudaea]MBN8886695.1 serine/threonine protein kinase [Rudaea sp.]MBR0346672.1 serine/threonine protein kinase [Rudaea sp.]